MAKAKKRSAKAAARKTPAAKKSAAAKKATAKRNVAAKKAVAKKAPVKSKVAPKKSAAHETAKPKQKPVKQIKAKPERASPPPQQGKPNTTPNDKKKLAVQHMWDLVQAKKQRAAQTPAWQAIEHHDHPAPRTSTDLSTDQGGSSMPPEMPGHRDRGTG